MEKYIKQIEKARSKRELNDIIEIAANDETISNNEYCSVYDEAIKKYYDLLKEI